MRKPIPKTLRPLIHSKYDGHCAYCGCPITLKNMQIDHLVSIDKGGTNHPDNLMPSCRLCNYYKSYYTLEAFRAHLSTLMERVKKPFIYRLASAYGMVQEQPWDGRFYFETTKQTNQTNHETR